jgi:hypothetical protein
VINKLSHRRHPYEAFLGPVVYVRHALTGQVSVLDRGFKLFYAFRSWNFGRDACFYKHFLVFLDDERRLVRFNVLQADSASNDCQPLFQLPRADACRPQLETFQLLGSEAFLLFENGELLALDLGRRRLRRLPRLFQASARPAEERCPVFTTLGSDGTHLLAASVPEQQPGPKRDAATVYLLERRGGRVLSELTVAYSHLFQGSSG